MRANKINIKLAALASESNVTVASGELHSTGIQKYGKSDKTFTPFNAVCMQTQLSMRK